jgi:hypothetical protein
MRLLLSLKAEIQALIRCSEGEYAGSVLEDFEEGVNALPDLAQQIRYCLRWLQMYTSLRRSENEWPTNTRDNSTPPCLPVPRNHS